ncbi:MAG: M20/M25/M40 family metallo-hydrolase [Planctomycetaceae bacterium]
MPTRSSPVRSTRTASRPSGSDARKTVGKATSSNRRTSPPATSGPDPLEPDLAAARRRVVELMAIRGVSGEEKDVAERVIAMLATAGCPQDAITVDAANRKTPLAGNVGNLIVRLPGTRPGPRRLLMAHMDTVPVCLGAKPVLARSGGREVVKSADPATGLGADDRAGVAVVLSTAVEILSKGLPHPPLTFFFAIQEEVGLWGARLVSAQALGRPKLAFNFDGGAAEKVTIGATGGHRLDIRIDGIPSHAGVAPEKGVSAVAIAALAIADLVREGWHGLIVKGGRRGTSNVGVIHAGSATNVVADQAMLRAEARGHDPGFRNRIVKAIEKAFHDAAKAIRSADGRTGKVTIAGHLDYEAFRLSDDEPSVVAAAEAVRSVGRSPVFEVSNGGLDANWMAANGIPTVTLGCGQMEIHTTGEMLDLAAFDSACRIALRLATAD